jgi:hypothetical protein
VWGRTLPNDRVLARWYREHGAAAPMAAHRIPYYGRR